MPLASWSHGPWRHLLRPRASAALTAPDAGLQSPMPQSSCIRTKGVFRQGDPSGLQ